MYAFNGNLFSRKDDSFKAMLQVVMTKPVMREKLNYLI